MIETRSVHEQLIAVCQEELAAGQWKAGDQFPSERELAAKHKISRATANKVLAKLVSEGWLVMKKGLGCFVSERPTLFTSLRRIESFTDFAQGQGFRPSTKVLVYQPGKKVPVAVKEALRLKAGEKCIFVKRLRLVDGEPVILEERWLPAALYPGLSVSHMRGSFYLLCREHYGLSVQGEDVEIRATMAPPWPGVSWTEPALRLEGAGFDIHSRPLWYQVLHYHGGRFALHNHTQTAVAIPKLQLRLT
jgi:DNA-binding GntR family transcriptional regulator